MASTQFKLQSVTKSAIFYEMTDPANTTREDIAALCKKIDIEDLTWKACGFNLIAFYREHTYLLKDEDEEDDEEEEEDD